MRTIDISNTISHAKPNIWRVSSFFVDYQELSSPALRSISSILASKQKNHKPVITMDHSPYRLLASTIISIHNFLPPSTPCTPFLSLIPQYSNPGLTTTNPLAPKHPPPPKNPPNQHSAQHTRSMPPTPYPPAHPSKPKYPINITPSSNPRPHISSPKSREVATAILHRRLHAPTHSLYFSRNPARNGRGGKRTGSGVPRHR